MFNVGDKVRRIVKDHLAADFKVGDIAEVLSAPGKVISLTAMRTGDIVYSDIAYLELVPTVVPMYGVTRVEIPTTIGGNTRKCHCDFRELLMHGCKCGGI